MRDVRAVAVRRFSGSDVRYAARQLRHAPVFSLLLWCCPLALGIGANTAIPSSIVNALLLRELPVREPGRLVRLSVSEDRAAWSYPLWTQLEDRQDARVENVFAFSTAGVDPTRGPGLDLSAGGPTDLANGLWVSGNFFGALGVAPSMGRAIVPSDDSRGGGADGPVAVISDAFWQRRFGRAPSAIGSRLSIERIPFTIVGVTPPQLQWPDCRHVVRHRASHRDDAPGRSTGSTGPANCGGGCR